MATKRVIAYFMHESEESFASSRMANAERTESFLVGDVDEGKIAELEQGGLVVQELPTPMPAETPGRSFEVAPGLRRRGPVERGIAPSAPPLDDVPTGRPAYYLVQLSGPLLETWRGDLAALGVTLLEHVPRNSYKALLTLAQLPAVRALPFVIGVRHYGREDTGVVVRPEASTAAPGAVDLRPFDIRLQPDAAPGDVLQWIRDHGLALAGAKGRKIRVVADAASPLLDELAAHPDVERVEEYVVPRLHNDVARELLGIDPPAGAAGAAGIGLTGQGQIVAVADTGLDDQHPDFAGRIDGVVALGRPNDSTDPHGHGTHVAGSVLGDGSASGGQVRGAAPGARLFFQSLLDASGGLGGLPFDLADLFLEAHQAGARIHNNSWGAATQSMYTLNSAEVDEFVANHRDMLIVISAGNEGTAASPLKSQPGFVDWLSIGSPASAKNALVVGASRSRRDGAGEGFAALSYGSAWPADFPDPPIGNEKVSGDPEAMAAFSSRGPCDDRRIKPDLVAPGTDILSAKSSRAPLRNFWGPAAGNAKYAYMGGTSMAAPLVAGCAALVREYYVSVRGHDPSAALLKATLINSTRRLTAADSVADHPKLPNFHQGFGCLHLPSGVPHAARPALKLEFLDPWKSPPEQFSRSGQRFRHVVDVAGGADLRVCLAWTDAPDRGLQNSLVLFVQHLPSNRKWVANADVPLAIASPDPDNNVQLVRIDQPPAGDYLIQIAARNLLKPDQDYALVVAGELGGAMAPF